MISKYKIDLKGFENYRVDEYGNIYRLPYTDSSNKSYSLKKLKKCPIKKRWGFTINGKYEKRSEGQLRPHLILDDAPILLTKEKNLPF